MHFKDHIVPVSLKEKHGANVTNIIPAPEETPAVQESLYSQYKKRKMTLEAVVADCQVEEYTRYFNSPLAKEGTNVLTFWKAHSVDYPILSAMAKDYLTVQASSVSSERAFSSGTDLVTADRCSLSGKTIEMTQFLKFHF